MHFMKKAVAALCVAALLGTSAVIPAAAADSGADILKTADFYLTFEDGIKDDMGKYEFKADGDVPTVDGKFGKGIATDSDDHYVYSDDVEFGTDSWTLTSWVKIDEHSGDQVLFGNKDWNSGGNPGWLITPRDGDWKINGNPGSRFDFQYSYKDSVLKSEKGDWHHMAISVDREAGTLAFYINGVPVLETYSIAEYGDGDLDGITFTMGQDGTGVYADGALKANFDEVALFRRALTAEEIAAVYTYAPDGYEPAVVVTKDAAGGGRSSDPAPAIGAENGYVTDGLQIYYDGANNTGAGQNKNSTVWRDVSGNGYDFEVSLDGENRWTDKSYYIDSTANYFPEKVKDIANGDQYTIELALGEIDQPGTNWISLIISDNDEFSLFVRVENDNLEFKYNDNNTDRPVAEGGADLVNDSTVAVTFDIEDQDCFLYVDGELLYEAVPVEVNHANYMHLGSEDAKRNWLGDVYAIRFYDRELTPEEIAQNAAADNARFRGGPAVTPVSADGGAAPAAENATLTILGFDYKDCGDNANEALQYGSEDPNISTSIPLKPLDGATAEGAWFDFDITTVDAGDVEFSFLYAAKGERYMDVTFNGETKRVVCPDTGNFQTFDKTSVTFTGVPAGTATLRLAAPSDYSDSVKTPNVDIIYVTGPVDASAAAEPAAEPAAAELLNKSWDNIFIDGEMMVNGNADAWLADNPVEGDISLLTVRGWAYLSTPITGFAYAVDGGDAVKSADYIVDRPDVKGAISEDAEGFEIEVDVDGLEAGEHLLKFYALDADGGLVDITFDLPFALEKSEKPAEEPAPEPEAPAADAPAAEAPAAEPEGEPEAPAAEEPAAEEPAANEPESPAPAPEPAKSGCGSMIGGGFIVLTAVLGAAWVSKRR